MVKECCEGSELGTKPRFKWIDDFNSAFQYIDNTRTSQIDFASLSPECQQAWVNVILHEMFRHLEDIHRGWKELAYIERKFGIRGQSVYVSVWNQILPKGAK